LSAENEGISITFVSIFFFFALSIDAAVPLYSKFIHRLILVPFLGFFVRILAVLQCFIILEILSS
jgi:hypothetical protein